MCRARLCKSLGPAKAPGEGLARAWLGSGRGFWQRNLNLKCSRIYRTCTEQMIPKIKNKPYTWGLRRDTSRARVAASVSWCDGGGGGYVATLVCGVSVVLVKVLVMQHSTYVIVSKSQRKRKINHTWGSRHDTSRAPAAASVSWCDGGGDDDVATWFVVCLLSIVEVLVMASIGYTYIIVSKKEKETIRIPGARDTIPLEPLLLLLFPGVDVATWRRGLCCVRCPLSRCWCTYIIVSKS